MYDPGSFQQNVEVCTGFNKHNGHLINKCTGQCGELTQHCVTHLLHPFIHSPSVTAVSWSGSLWFK